MPHNGGVSTVSVVIPAKNVERYLEGALRSLLENRFPRENFEIVVVDNGSTDRTAEIARSLADRVVDCPKGTISKVRNTGVDAATGDVIAFLDADCLAAPDWLEQGLSAVTQEPCICGYNYDVPQTPHWIEEIWYAQRPPGRIEFSSLGAGNLWVTKRDFQELGGFDETLVTGEDAELCSRARQKLKVISDDRVRVIHLGNPKSLRAFLKREIWYGLGAFGSFKVERFDKPLAGTVAFVLFTLLQVAGIVWCVSLFLCATLGLIALLAATLFFRRAFIREAADIPKLALLYYVFYLGRAIGLFYALRGRAYDHLPGRAATRTS